jgi:hypothetical protein
MFLGKNAPRKVLIMKKARGLYARGLLSTKNNSVGSRTEYRHPYHRARRQQVDSAG